MLNQVDSTTEAPRKLSEKQKKAVAFLLRSNRPHFAPKPAKPVDTEKKKVFLTDAFNKVAHSVPAPKIKPMSRPKL